MSRFRLPAETCQVCFWIKENRRARRACGWMTNQNDQTRYKDFPSGGALKTCFKQDVIEFICASLLSEISCLKFIMRSFVRQYRENPSNHIRNSCYQNLFKES